jgi:hypothetical protein
MRYQQIKSTFLISILCSIFINCNNGVVGGGCKYVDTRGYAKILSYQTATPNLNPGFSYANFIFIDSSTNDTTIGLTIIKTECVNDSIIIFSKLYKCTWNKKISGACGSGIITTIDSLPDSCKFETFMQRQTLN